MREAVGSTFLFNIMITFIFFFASFLAIAINYSQAFRVKNQIINYIEQYEGVNNTSKNEIIDYVTNAGYFREKDCSIEDGEQIQSEDGTRSVKGLCVKKLNNKNSDTYYRVTTYVKFNLPIIGDFFTIPVKGETKIITNN